MRDATGVADVKIQLDFIRRAKFNGDISLKIPQLLKHGGPKRFIDVFQPRIYSALTTCKMADLIKNVELQGMYINITLTDIWLLRSAEAIVKNKDEYLKNSSMLNESIIVEYSSPNVAKNLHAGHIRSTIIGTVLSNIFEACGATVFRVSHINDFGGFGFLLEGYRRFYPLMPKELTEAQRLVTVYNIRRSLERIVDSKASRDGWSVYDLALMDIYFPNLADFQAAKAALVDFTAASDIRFAKLEAGDNEEVTLWKNMVSWSLAEFNEFYLQLNINIDFVIGESFYLQEGLNIIRSSLNAGTVEVFSLSHANQKKSEIDYLVRIGDISQIEGDFQKYSIDKDINSTVAHLPSGERLVLLRSDGRSIYSTRDIGAIALRNDIFCPSKVVYVVGQEQRSHFERLFDAAQMLGLVKSGYPELKHLYFGFYVDAKTGRKLSSRDSVSNVMALLELAKKYFYSRLSDRGDSNEEELNKTARQLTIGSIVFNDLKQDIRGSVDIDVLSLENTVKSFESSGGAYVVYTACRARSILRRSGVEPKSVDAINIFNINNQEAELLLLLQLTPLKVMEAGINYNPTILLRHLIEVAKEYNSYYSAAPVLCDGVINEARLLITNAVQLILVNGLSICHIDTPEFI